MTTVRPNGLPSETAISDLTAQQQIDLLAQEHNIIYNHSQLDEIGATSSNTSTF
jgi:hypothetical protein